MHTFETLLNMNTGASVALLMLRRRMSSMFGIALPEMQCVSARSHSSRSGCVCASKMYVFFTPRIYTASTKRVSQPPNI